MAEETWPVEWCSLGTVRTDANGALVLKLSSVDEAKLTIKEVRLQKRTLAAEKKATRQKMAAIRRNYAEKNARRGPSVRGGGSFGRLLRSFDQLSRSADRNNREDELAPLQTWLDQVLEAERQLDLIIHHCEVYIHQQSVKQ